MDRELLLILLAQVAEQLPDGRLAEGQSGRYHVEVAISVDKGAATFVKSAAYFEQFKDLEARA